MVLTCFTVYVADERVKANMPEPRANRIASIQMPSISRKLEDIRCGCTGNVGWAKEGVSGTVRITGLAPRKRCPQRPQKFKSASQTVRQLGHDIVSRCSVSLSLVVCIITT